MLAKDGCPTCRDPAEVMHEGATVAVWARAAG